MHADSNETRLTFEPYHGNVRSNDSYACAQFTNHSDEMVGGEKIAWDIDT